MANFKKKCKYYLGYGWQIFKSSIPSMFMYACAGVILMLIFLNQGETKNLHWENKHLVWTLVCIIGAAGYDALVAWANGGSNYEMLVSGNIKRSTAEMYGSSYKMSSHKEAKEYRVWKGFTFGIVTALLTIAAGIVFGCMQADIDANGLNAPTMIFTLLSGWSVLPFFAMNSAGASISYFITIAFAALPIAISGGFYIAGAYARRNKVIRQQQLADQAAKAEANKEKKINYGGLPGTKPKKKRK
jgi:hypothetical protein